MTSRFFDLKPRPAMKGGLLALLAAALFGMSTPFVQKLGAGTGPFLTASLLYAGAALMGLILRQPAGREARLVREDWPRLACMALLGAVVGPVALAWGLQRTSATGASLMLCFEGLFTVVLAQRFFGEAMDRRVWGAILLLFAGGLALVLDQRQAGNSQLLGILAILMATAAWGLDNTLSRSLAERDPGQIVLGKAIMGIALSTTLGLSLGESIASFASAAGLFILGVLGYGVSQRFYLLAQRAIGAARTGSVFAFAPFIGAGLAVALGDRSGGAWMWVGGVLMLLGVAIHLNESHQHEHGHKAMRHEHAHTHDDGHHDHVHDPMPEGAHSHFHVHRPLRHSHAHVPDVHHSHTH